MYYDPLPIIPIPAYLELQEQHTRCGWMDTLEQRCCQMLLLTALHAHRSFPLCMQASKTRRMDIQTPGGPASSGYLEARPGTQTCRLAQTKHNTHRHKDVTGMATFIIMTLTRRMLLLASVVSMKGACNRLLSLLTACAGTRGCTVPVLAVAKACRPAMPAKAGAGAPCTAAHAWYSSRRFANVLTCKHP